MRVLLNVHKRVAEAESRRRSRLPGCNLVNMRNKTFGKEGTCASTTVPPAFSAPHSPAEVGATGHRHRRMKTSDLYVRPAKGQPSLQPGAVRPTDGSYIHSLSATWYLLPQLV